MSSESRAMQTSNDTDAALFSIHQTKTAARLAENATLLRVIRAEIDVLEARIPALEAELPTQTTRETALENALAVDQRELNVIVQEILAFRQQLDNATYQRDQILHEQPALLEQLEALLNQYSSPETRRVELRDLYAVIKDAPQEIPVLEEQIATCTARVGALREEYCAAELRLGMVVRREYLQVLKEEIKKNRFLLSDAERQLGILHLRSKALLRSTTALRQPIGAEAFSASPIRRVPADVLEIFTLLKPDEIQAVGSGMILSPNARLRGMEGRSVRSCRPVVVLRLLAVLPGRGQSRQEIFSAGEGRATDDSDADADGALAALAAHSEQFYSLRLVGGDGRSAMLHGIRGRLPLLEVLQLPSLSVSFIREFEIAPRLHTLTLDNTSEFMTDYSVIPCAQIRSLDLLRGAGPFGLSNFTNLTSLTCDLQQTPLKQWIARDTLLPSLTSWRINFQDKAVTPPNFFSSFTAPALESLEIAALMQPAQLAAFLLRSQCALTRLVLHKSWVSMAELLQICASTPQLRHLAVQDGPATMVTERLLGPLTARAGSSALLPELESLVIEGTYMFRDASLVEMLESRSGLTRVRLMLLDRVVKDADVQRLKAMPGVDVSLECQNGARQLVRVL
ncbi:hypothetical protein FB451DRAFT_1369244 [Mycena latifolia]|nr:hypothetical protein FB451DRAFT_1369244 [Mycena latifolia]